MSSSSACKENVCTTTSVERRSAPMGNSDVFGSSSPSHTLFSVQAEGTVSYSTTPSQRSERSTVSKPLVNSARSNTLSPMANHATKRKRTVAESDTRDYPNAVQSLQESIMQHTPNPRMRKQVRHVVTSPGQLQAAFGGVGSPPRSGGQVQTDRGPMTPTRKGKPKVQPTELAARSPHALNPRADYIPPSRLALSPQGVSVRRRSVTPIPPYEPPRERYTPPREVVVSPPTADRKPVRRSAAKKKRVSVKTEKPPVQLWVKTEPPEIDLTTPAPPASPGDDPILLVGPPSIKVQRPSLPPSDLRGVSLVDFEMDLNLPENRECSATRGRNGTRALGDSGPSIPPAFDFSGFNGDDGNSFSEGLADSSGEVDSGGVAGDDHFANIDDCGLSDSDSDGGHAEEGASIGEGDFTGKFLTFQAPLKLDPPEDEDDRMEKWARPISPHPKRLSLVEPKEEEVDGDLDETIGQATGDHSSDGITLNQPDPETDAEGLDGARSGYVGKRGRRMTLSEVEAIKFGPTALPPKATTSDISEVDSDKEPHVHVIEDDSFVYEVGSLDRDGPMQTGLRVHTDLDTTNILDNDLNHQFDSTLSNNNSYRQATSPITEENDASRRSASEYSSGESSQSTLNNPEILGPGYLDHVRNAKDNQYEKDETQDRLEDHSASLLREPCPPISDCETEIATEEDQEDNSDGGAGDVSVVKIMSDDPMAAARAAAILKLHDYDMVARKLRRRKTSAGGVSKAYSSPIDTQLWRRRTVAGLSAEDTLSANISLPQLLEKAEEDLRSSPARSRCGSVALSSVESPQRSRWHDYMYENADEPGIRDWSKADWKLLDSCFTDERYDLGEQMDLEPGSLADVDDVHLESVVGRFVMIMGGAEKVESHGPSWTVEKLMARAKALCKRQRSGYGAPPTPDVSARFATPSRYSTMSPAPSMIVPEFTPASVERKCLFDFGSVSRKARLPPPSSESFFKVPSTLPARHSSLRQDVTSADLETPKPSRALDLFGFATPSRNSLQQRQDDSDDESVAQEVDAMLTPITASRVRHFSRPDSAVKRSLNYISSWLKPDTYKSKKEERQGSQLPGLPVPPSDVLAKPRGPVETPAPKAPPKSVPPKELVSLEHVPPPQPTKIPRRQRPQRLVDLTHVPTPQPKEEMKRIVSRRSSTSSVKDLIKEFEEKEKGKVQAVPPRVAELRRQASIGSLKGKGKPAWKP